MPLLSLSVALLWVVVGAAVTLGFGSRAQEAKERVGEAVSYAIANPVVQLPLRLVPAVRAALPTFDSNETFAFLRSGGKGEARQREFDLLVARAFETLDSHPHRQLGVVPAALAPHSFATHWLVHAGFLHLAATLVLWLLAAPMLERAWGRGPFAATFGVAALFGAGVYAAVHAAADRPLIGGSALAAAAAGAVVARFRTEPVEPLDWLRGTLDLELRVPAFALGVLWLLCEAALWWAIPGALPAGLDNAVGVTAHVAAAALGAGAPFALERLGWIEMRRAAPARRLATDRFDFEQVRAARARGDADAAFAMLEAELKRSARNRDAVSTFWEMCIERGEAERGAPALIQLVREELRRGAEEVAVAHWRELAQQLPKRRLDPGTLLRLVPAIRRVDGEETAAIALQQLLEASDGDLGAPGLLATARLAEELAPRLAALAARRALGTGALAEGPRLEAEALVARYAQAGPEGAEAEDAEPEKPEDLPRNVFYEESDRSAFGELGDLGAVPEDFPAGALSDAVPRGLGENGLALVVEGQGELELAWTRLRAVAVAGVQGLGPKPVVLLDLLVDGGATGRPLRVLRLRSDRFSPRRLMPEAPGPVDALRALVERLLARSAARALPDAEGAALRPVRVFADLAAYHAEVLRPAGAELS
jgi:membrane associated rhomboid family serine protease